MGPDFPFSFQVLPGKPRKTVIFGSRGNVGNKTLCLPKYGRFIPHIMTRNTLWTAPDFAIYFTCSRPINPARTKPETLFFPTKV